jgi:hypothetical protein
MVTIFGCPRETTRRATRPTVALRAVVSSYVAIMIYGGPAQGHCPMPSRRMSPRESIGLFSWPSAIHLALRPDLS